MVQYRVMYFEFRREIFLFYVLIFILFSCQESCKKNFIWKKNIVITYQIKEVFILRSVTLPSQ